MGRTIQKPEISKEASPRERLCNVILRRGVYPEDGGDMAYLIIRLGENKVMRKDRKKLLEIRNPVLLSKYTLKLIILLS